jgi:rare lipoprotein A
MIIRLTRAIALIFIFIASPSVIGNEGKIFQTGVASWYKHGKFTADGRRYNPYGLSAAHRTLKFGTKVKVTNLSNHKSVIVVINDRGPFIKGRIIDLSLGAARIIGLDRQGTTSVTLKEA